MNDIEAFFCRKIRTLPPFGAISMEFCEAISQSLFAHAKIKNYPDIMALAFWLRKSHLERLRENFFASKEVLVPRGTAFHIAPANVETMFVYSWILSLLSGNSNIVRLPSKKNENLDVLFETIKITLHQERFRSICETTCLISYGHEEVITKEISAKADVRIIWGGDATIQTLRQIPLQAGAKEIVFPDRYSFSLIDAAYFLTQPPAEQQKLERNLYNDIFWYDQNACSSPRVVFWKGSPSEAYKAGKILYEGLQEFIESKEYSLTVSSILEKETSIYSIALEQPIEEVIRFSNEMTVIALKQFYPQCRENQGSGLIYHVPIEDLGILQDWMTVKDQTLAYYGFEKEGLKEWIKSLNGIGVTRIIPIGQALNFDYLWDGYNLLNELTKTIDIL